MLFKSYTVMLKIETMNGIVFEKDSVQLSEEAANIRFNDIMNLIKGLAQDAGGYLKICSKVYFARNLISVEVRIKTNYTLFPKKMT